MIDSPKIISYSALSLYLRLGAVASPELFYDILTPYLSLSVFSRRSCFCIIFCL